jgi:hypothetical protein
MNVVPMPKPSPPPPTSHQNTTMNLAADVTTKCLRSLRSKQDYQRRKTSRVKDQLTAQKRELISVQEDSANKLELMQDELNFAETEISHLQHTNQQSLLLVGGTTVQSLSRVLIFMSKRCKMKLTPTTWAKVGN